MNKPIPLLVFILMALLISGCTGTSTPKEEGLTGKVYLGTSSLGMMGVTLTAGSTIATSDSNGNFNITGLSAGEYEVTAQSYIGITTGTATVDTEGKGSLSLRVSYPMLWVDNEFVEIAGLDENGPVIRWENPKELTYAFESGCAEDLKTTYREVFSECQTYLGGFFTFREVSSTTGVNITIGKEEILDPLGTMGRAYVYYNNSVITRVRIVINPLFITRKGILKHELSHALGMGHSPNPNHIISTNSPYLTDYAPEEKNYLKAMYCLRPGLTFSSLGEIIQQPPQSGVLIIE